MTEEYIINKLKGLMPAENHVPQGVLYSALKTSVQKDLSETLNVLLKSGKLTYRKTLNDILITP